jgi:hypothetical protein
MSVDISGFEDVSKERKSKVWINMLFHKQKGLALCKICLEKQFTRIVYAKNGSTKTASDHLKTHGVCENNVVASIPGQKSCKDVFQQEDETVPEAVARLAVSGQSFRNICESTMLYKMAAVSTFIFYTL